MPGELTEITEIVTALGTLRPTLDEAMSWRPSELVGVGDEVWMALRARFQDRTYEPAFAAAFANGQAFLRADEGLRGRPPRRVEWKGPHRPPGDDVIPADLRIDHVYLVSCKYLSKVLLNPGPSRLFDRLLVGDERSAVHWFSETAPVEFQALYAAARQAVADGDFPERVTDLRGEPQQRALRALLGDRRWPPGMEESWTTFCTAVATVSTARWRAAMREKRDKEKLLRRMLRITSATYFVLGSDRHDHLRLRVDSAWDWAQRFDLRSFTPTPGVGGQPEVRWQAVVRDRLDMAEHIIDGHVEIRWSHGRFVGMPEAKVYLDTPHRTVPGYHPLS